MQGSAGSAASTKSKTIMVVDDNPDFLQLVEELLSDEGYQVTVCREGDHAYRRAKQEQPNLLILDVRMVGLHEWQVLDMIKLDPATASIPIIICSAAVREIEAVEQRLRDQECDILFKPFNIDELVAKVRGHIGPPNGES